MNSIHRLLLLRRYNVESANAMVFVPFGNGSASDCWQLMSKVKAQNLCLRINNRDATCVLYIQNGYLCQ